MHSWSNFIIYYYHHYYCFFLVYVDASDLCNDLVFQLCSGGTTSRNWNIKVFSLVCSLLIHLKGYKSKEYTLQAYYSVLLFLLHSVFCFYYSDFKTLYENSSNKILKAMLPRSNQNIFLLGYTV